MSEPSPDPRELRLNAALDGELDDDSARALEQELAADPALAADYRRLEAARDAVRRHGRLGPAPRGLMDRVLALAADAVTADAPPTVVPLAPRPLAPRQRLAWREAAPIAAGFAALGFAAGLGLTALRPPDASRAVADALVADYARAAIAGRPFDVASSDRHTVKPWLAGRTTVSADIVDLAAQGFPLAGGRVAVVDRVPAPTLVYRHAEHMIAVTELPAGTAGAAAKAALTTVDGYHVARWGDADLAYVAVSDMDERGLEAFVAAWRDVRATAPVGAAPGGAPGGAKE